MIKNNRNAIDLKACDSFPRSYLDCEREGN